MSVTIWKCPHCGAKGFGTMKPHDKPHGVACRASGMLSEREIQTKLAAEFCQQEESSK
jgi:ribosomal protein L37AE/L43A